MENQKREGENIEKALLSVKELGVCLGVHYRTVWRLLSKNLIPGKVKLGASIKFRRDIINEWILAGLPSADKFESKKSA